MRNYILIAIITLFCFSLFANPPKPGKKKNQQSKNKEVKKEESKEPSIIEIFEMIKNISYDNHEELESFFNGTYTSKLGELPFKTPFSNIAYLQTNNSIKDFCLYQKNILRRIQYFYFIFNKEKQKLIRLIPNEIGIKVGETYNVELERIILNLDLLYDHLKNFKLDRKARELGLVNFSNTHGDLNSYCNLLQD